MVGMSRSMDGALMWGKGTEMPELEWNSAYWNGGYDWSAGGEEWSEVWGGSEPQWFGSLYPRLHRHLPATSVLEIAQGYGRWTQYMLPLCQRYIGFDLSQECVDACRRTFAKAPHATFSKTDGISLPGVPDGSIDFVFSFDSLVHVELDVMLSYIPEILRVLSPSGVAFIHHSNLAPFGDSIGQPHARGKTVSARNVASAISESGGSVLLQEIITWGGEHMHDCLTLFGHGLQGHISTQVQNPHFMEEAFLIRDFQSPWSAVSTIKRNLNTPS